MWFGLKNEIKFWFIKTFKTRNCTKPEVGSTFSMTSDSPILTGESAQKIKELLKTGPSEETEYGKIILKEMFKDKEEPTYYGKWRLETDEEMPNPMFKLVICTYCNKPANSTYKFCPHCGKNMYEKSE